jgi:hypothetical protein
MQVKVKVDNDNNKDMKSNQRGDQILNRSTHVVEIYGSTYYRTVQS